MSITKYSKKSQNSYEVFNFRGTRPGQTIPHQIGLISALMLFWQADGADDLQGHLNLNSSVIQSYSGACQFPRTFSSVTL